MSLMSMPPLFAFLPQLNAVELIIIAVVILLLFGNRLPSVMRSMGKGIVEFKKGLHEVEDDRPSESPPAPTKPNV